MKFLLILIASLFVSTAMANTVAGMQVIAMTKILKSEVVSNMAFGTDLVGSINYLQADKDRSGRVSMNRFILGYTEAKKPYANCEVILTLKENSTIQSGEPNCIE